VRTSIRAKPGQRQQGDAQNEQRGNQRQGRAQQGQRRQGNAQNEEQRENQRQGQAQQGQGAQGTVNLTSGQRTKIRQDIFSGGNVPRVDNVNFSLRTGTIVPSEVRIVDVPETVIAIHPEWREDLYFVVRDDLGPGSTLTLMISRGDKAPFKVTLQRDIVRALSVMSELEPEGFGYVRISQVVDDTPRNFKDAIESLKRQERSSRLRPFNLDDHRVRLGANRAAGVTHAWCGKATAAPASHRSPV
jgi:hypothetical protein